MKITGSIALTIFCLMITIVACQPKEEVAETPVIDIEAIKQEIQDKENQFAELYNRKEMKSIGYYADDATTFAQNSPPLVGKPAIVEYLMENLDTTNLNQITFTTHEVFPSSDGEQVVEIGYYKVVDGEGLTVNTGNYMTLFVKRNGQYVCLRDMSACDMPLELE